MNLTAMKKTFPLTFKAVAAWIALVSAALGGTPMTVTDQKGRSIDIELVSLSGDSVTFSRKGDPKEFTMPITDFAEISQNLIRKQAALLPTVFPKILPEVVIGKRRSKNDSYYMVKQEISSTVKLTNPNNKVAIPAVDVQVVFIGQNRRTPDALIILSKQSFEASIEPTKTFVKEMEPFVTSYDSDNKGSGNIGGYQYFGYILAIKDPDGKVVQTEATAGSIRQALKDKPHIIEDILAFKEGKLLTDKLEPSKSTATFRVPQ
jgi:hypothetical protein